MIITLNEMDTEFDSFKGKYIVLLSKKILMILILIITLESSIKILKINIWLIL